jgi:imidazolonepropionase-like amidohydrolase
MSMSLRELFAVLMVAALATAVSAQDLLIRAGHLIDPATGKVTQRQEILIHDGKVASVGEHVKAPGAEAIDLSSEWVLPGLGDAHQHLTLDLPPAPQRGSVWESVRLTQSTAERTLRGLRNAAGLLQGGFTLVRDVGNAADYADTEVRRAIERGWFPGPTVLNAGKIITPFGGQDPGIAPEAGAWWHDEYIDADTTDEVRAAVRRNIFYGAKVIKLAADSNPYHFSEELVRAAVDEAHEAGLTVAVHVYGGRAAKDAILGGADSIEHGYDLSDELLELMKEKATFLVATEMTFEDILPQFGNPGLDRQSFEARSIQRLQRAYRQGVEMAFGTDAALDAESRSRTDQMLDQAALWQRAGLPTAFILKCMTVNVAKVMHLQDTRGSITPGLAADIIATSENPLENIEGLRKVNFVMKDGRVVRRPPQAVNQ